MPENSQLISDESERKSLSFLVSYTTNNDDHTTDTEVVDQLVEYYKLKSQGLPIPRTSNSHLTYDDSHKLWFPQIERERVSSILTDSTQQNQQAKLRTFAPAMNSEAFINYLDTSNVIGSQPLPTLIHHTSCEVNDVVYILGGCKALHKDYNVDNLDLSKFILKRGVKLPLPIDSDLLNHPLIVPNDSLYVASTLTNRVDKPDISGEIPPPLLSMSASVITKRHIFYYGGFQIIDNVVYDGENFVIEKSVLLNNHGYILDIVTHKFQKFELTAHPNLITKLPLTVPRFGHSSTSIDFISNPATVYIMGGYSQKAEQGTFEAISDLWKLELSIAYEGDNDYVEFGDIVLATPVAPIGAPPSARSFHSTDVYGSEIIYYGGTDGHQTFGDIWAFDVYKETWNEVESTFEGQRAQKKSMGHQSIILDKYLVPLIGSGPLDSDVDTKEADNGIPDVPSLYHTRKYTDSSSNCLFYLFFCFDLEKKRWLVQRIYHDYHIPLAGGEDELSHSGNIGGTVTMGNSRTLLIGGELTGDPRYNIIGKSHILNSGFISFEFPLGCSVNRSRERD